MRKPYGQMNTAELAQATREFEDDYAFERGRPLTADGRKAHALARAKGDREGARRTKVIALPVDRATLREADAFARRHGLTRSQLFARGVRAVMVAAGAD